RPLAYRRGVRAPARNDRPSRNVDTVRQRRLRPDVLAGHATGRVLPGRSFSSTPRRHSAPRVGASVAADHSHVANSSMSSMSRSSAHTIDGAALAALRTTCVVPDRSTMVYVDGA